jgi:hypothetical protein
VEVGWGVATAVGVAVGAGVGVAVVDGVADADGAAVASAEVGGHQNASRYRCSAEEQSTGNLELPCPALFKGSHVRESIRVAEYSCPGQDPMERFLTLGFRSVIHIPRVNC